MAEPLIARWRRLAPATRTRLDIAAAMIGFPAALFLACWGMP